MGTGAGRGGWRVPVRWPAPACGSAVPPRSAARRAGGGVSELRDDHGTAPDSVRELPRPAEAAEAPERPGGEAVAGAEDAGYARRGGGADRGGQDSSRRAEAGGDQRLGERAQGMTREEYADYMRALPAQDLRGQYPDPGTSARDGDAEAFQRLGERAQGMTREEYAVSCPAFSGQGICG
jgi:hypothetical protein